MKLKNSQVRIKTNKNTQISVNEKPRNGFIFKQNNIKMQHSQNAASR